MYFGTKIKISKSRESSRVEHIRLHLLVSSSLTSGSGMHISCTAACEVRTNSCIPHPIDTSVATSLVIHITWTQYMATYFVLAQKLVAQVSESVKCMIPDINFQEKIQRYMHTSIKSSAFNHVKAGLPLTVLVGACRALW